MIISKTYSPIQSDEVCRILGIELNAYSDLVASGQLAKSLNHNDDPGKRLSFHNFWDLVTFSTKALIDGSIPEEDLVDFNGLLHDFIGDEDDTEFIGDAYCGHIDLFGGSDINWQSSCVLTPMDLLMREVCRTHNELCDTTRSFLRL